MSKQPGQIVLFRFPHTDLTTGKLRPALLLAKVPGTQDDWLICMISSRVHQYVPDFDDIVQRGDADYGTSGLKMPSVIRVGRMAVVSGNTLLGAIGEISLERLDRIRNRLARWLLGNT